MNVASRTASFNAVWLSDLHLGSADCRAEYLSHFLARHPTRTLYLLGDVVDLWALRRRLFWPASHRVVVEQILALAAHTRVVYVPGNHDEDFRALCGRRLLGIEIRHQAVHRTAGGRRLLLLHGDEFDTLVRASAWAGWAADLGYELLLSLNALGNRARRTLGLPYRSLAQEIKIRLGPAGRAIRTFEVAAARAARRLGLDGVVCGHIHQPEIRFEEGVLYCNCGDWVESLTALVEHPCGRLELLHWGDARRALKCERRALAVHASHALSQPT